MSYYAVAVVPPDWNPSKPLAFSDHAAQQWDGRIVAGTRVLLYKPSPINALVAEAEAHDAFLIRLADWPETNQGEPLKTGFGEMASHILPIRVLYTRDDSIQIPLRTIQEYLEDETFPAEE